MAFPFNSIQIQIQYQFFLTVLAQSKSNMWRKNVPIVKEEYEEEKKYIPNETTIHTHQIESHSHIAMKKEPDIIDAV